MSKSSIAKVFKHGRSQAVRLPAEFRVTGDKVRVRRVENGILLEPLYTDVEEWFAMLDKYAQHKFMEEGRDQPPMPEDEEGKSFD